MATPTRNQVFISYSHEDTQWLKKFKTSMKPYTRDGAMELWDDTRIQPGRQWRDEIEQALQRAKVAVLLVSSCFLESDFIAENELPLLFNAEKEARLTIFWIPVSASSFEETAICHYQAAHDPAKPLDTLEPAPLNAAWVDIAKKLKQAVNFRPGPLCNATPSPAAGRNTFYVNLPEPNPYFKGREETLQALHDALNMTGKIGVSQIKGLSGLGGIGKTQTAIEYAWRYREHYHTILWMRGDTATELQQGFRRAAEELNLLQGDTEDTNKIRKAIHNWFARHTHWLLIIDNVEPDTQKEIKPYFPQTDQGHVLITTRAPTLQSLGIINSLKLNVLSSEEALSFLFSRVGRDCDTCSEDEKDAAKEVVEEVGGFPLALEQAAAYIVTNESRFEDYLASFRKRRSEFLAHHPEIGDYPDTVATTWLLNFERIAQESPASADALYLSAFFDPDAIPFFLLRDAAAQSSPTLQTALKDVDDDPALLDELLSPLTRYSLIQRHKDEKKKDRGYYTLHRLVQDILHARLKSERLYKTWLAYALDTLFTAIQADEACRFFNLFPHAQRCLYLAQDADMYSAITAKLSRKLLRNLEKQGQETEITTFLYQYAPKSFRMLLQEATTQYDKHDAYLGLISVSPYTKAKAIFQEMVASGIRLDQVSYSTLLNRTSTYEEGRSVLNEMVASGIRLDQVSYSTLLNRTSTYEEGRSVLNEMVASGIRLDQVSYSTLLNRTSTYEEGRSVLNEMVASGIVPNQVSYNTLLNRTSTYEEGRSVLNEMVTSGIVPNQVSYSTLLNRTSTYEEGRSVLNEMVASGIVPNQVSYSTLLNRTSTYEEGRSVLNEMVASGIVPNQVSYNTLLNRTSTYEEGRSVLNEMVASGIVPNQVSYNTLLNRTSTYEEGRSVLNEMVASGIVPNQVSYSTLLNRTSTYEEGRSVLNEMVASGIVPNQVSYNTLLNRTSTYEEGRSVLNEMVASGIVPNQVSYSTFFKKPLQHVSGEELISWFLTQPNHPPRAVDALIANFRKQKRVEDLLTVCLYYPHLPAATRVFKRYGEGALSFFEGVDQADPEHRNASYAIAKVLQALGREEEALPFLRKAYRLAPMDARKEHLAKELARLEAKLEEKGKV